MKYVFVKQDDLKDCGVCSLLMIIKHYKGGCSKEYLRDLTKTTKDGTTFYNLIDAAEKFNFECRAVNGDVKLINEKELPVIAHVIINNYKHFIVIYKIDKKKNRLIIADPATRIKAISVEEFKKISTNNFILFKPKKQILKIVNKKMLYKIIKNNVKENKKIILKIFFLSTLYSLLTIFSSFYLTIIVNTMNYSTENIFKVIFSLFLFISVFKVIINYIKMKILIRYNYELDSCLFTYIYEKIIKLPYIYFKNRTTGEVLARLNDLDSVKDTFSKIIVSLFIDLLLIILPLLFLLFINIWLFTLVLVFITIYFLTYYLFKKRIGNSLDDLKEGNSKINSLLVDNINNLESIRNLNLEDKSVNNLKDKYKKYIDISIRYNNLHNKKNLLISLIDENLLLCIIALVVNLNIDVSLIFSFYFLSSLVMNSVKNLINFLYDLMNSKSSVRRISELCEIESNNNGQYFNNFVINSIKVKNFWYSYNSRDKIVNDVNLEINTGDKILITGPSGRGKSTLMKVLLGYLDDYHGIIKINDIDLKNINSTVLRESITYVSQNEDLFNLSIRDNILLNRDIQPDKFNYINKLVCVDEMMLNKNISYDYLIEEGGFNLSGGEKSRIILSRALHKNSSVYILDESLSSVNVELERKILMNVFNYLNDKIVIVVSHRFNNEDLFDKRIVL